MKVFQCGPGTHKCGKRCIPREYKCRQGEVKEPNSDDSLFTVSRETGSGNVIDLKKAAIVTGGLATVAAVAVGYIALNQGDRFQDGANVPPEIAQQALQQASMDLSIDAPLPELRNAYVMECERLGLQDVDVIDSIVGSPYEKYISPEVRNLAKARGVDMTNISVVAYDGVELINPDYAHMVGGRLVPMKDGSFLITIDKGTKYPRSPNDNVDYELTAASYGKSTHDVDHNVKGTLNHELTHFLQIKSGWVMTDEMYNLTERFIIPYTNLQLTNEGVVSYNTTMNSDQYEKQFSIYGEAMKSTNPSAISTRAGYQLARRMEVEAWMLNNTSELHRAMLMARK